MPCLRYGGLKAENEVGHDGICGFVSVEADFGQMQVGQALLCSSEGVCVCRLWAEGVCVDFGLKDGQREDTESFERRR